MTSSQAISERAASIKERIHASCRRVNRNPELVKLMAVSKTHPAEAIAAAAVAGLRLFGENRVQEFQQKLSALGGLGIGVQGSTGAESSSAENAVSVHLIGHLQSNKTGRAVEIFSGVDTVDSLKLAERLNDGAKKLGRQLPVLVEIKLSEETAKSGLAPESKELAELLERLPDLSGLQTRGLMTVAPLDENPDSARACFRRLRVLREGLAGQYSQLDFGELSMGMSGDFEIAIEEGSTLVRIGTAIFGARETVV